MKPGYKTTEFWVSVAAAAYNFALSSGALHQTDKIQAAVSAAATIALALGYTWARAFVKTKQGA